MENKKVRNANPKEYNGIQFKSTLEVSVYKALINNGFTPEYEKHKFILWKGIKPTVPYFTLNSKKEDILNLRKLANITYTPDFYLEYEGLKIIIEAKGKENDTFPIKFKMFRKIIEEKEDSNNYMIFEVFSVKQLLRIIQIIKEYAASRKN